MLVLRPFGVTRQFPLVRPFTIRDWISWCVLEIHTGDAGDIGLGAVHFLEAYKELGQRRMMLLSPPLGLRQQSINLSHIDTQQTHKNTLIASINYSQVEQPLQPDNTVNILTTNTTTTTSPNTANMGRDSFSETSTICSFEKETSPDAVAPVKLSKRQRVKRALRDIGHPPTYRYDLEHGIDTMKTVPVGPQGSNVLNQPSRI